jgi:hypothetical protein
MEGRGGSTSQKVMKINRSINHFSVHQVSTFLTVEIQCSLHQQESIFYMGNYKPSILEGGKWFRIYISNILKIFNSHYSTTLLLRIYFEVKIIYKDIETGYLL